MKRADYILTYSSLQKRRKKQQKQTDFASFGFSAEGTLTVPHKIKDQKKKQKGERMQKKKEGGKKKKKKEERKKKMATPCLHR